MAIVRPFCAIRPSPGLEKRVAALPYDVYNREEARKEVQREPLSFLAIDRAETQFPTDTDMYSNEVYKKASELLWNQLEEGIFFKDPLPGFYVYEQIMNNRSQIGIGACVSVDDYLNQVIRKHENTRADKEADRIRHVDICHAQTGPIFLAYHFQEELHQLIEEKRREEPIFTFVAEDQVLHRMWHMTETDQIAKVIDAFEKINTLYIADGHHRCASAVKVCEERRKKYPDHSGEEEFNYILAILFSEEQLMIMDYNRLVKDLNGYTKEQFLDRIKDDFSICYSGNIPVRPEKKGDFGMCLLGEWYQLSFNKKEKGRVNKNDLNETEQLDKEASLDVVEHLDVSILQRYVLDSVLGIRDPKTDKRIDFVGGIRGMEELERRTRQDCKVAFSLFPTSIHELFAVADQNRLMPPKSTWFEPKLRSGLLIHEIEE